MWALASLRGLCPGLSLTTLPMSNLGPKDKPGSLWVVLWGVGDGCPSQEAELPALTLLSICVVSFQKLKKKSLKSTKPFLLALYSLS